MANKWVYFSPHFDDVALSVGGLIWEQVQRGDYVEIWTICGGNAPKDRTLPLFAQQLHTRWKLGDDASNLRALEDENACRRLRVSHQRLPLPDCIYRYDPTTNQPIINSEPDLFKPYTRLEFDLLLDILKSITLSKDAQVVAPLGVGHHRDHALTRAVADHLYGPVWHYMDYPYAIQNDLKNKGFIPHSKEVIIQSISSQGMTAWKEAVACHHSQITTFWKSEQEMFTAIDAYAEIIQKNILNTYLWKL
jgi:LmbE family N-acetylglucosaminyl deacetylase